MNPELFGCKSNMSHTMNDDITFLYHTVRLPQKDNVLHMAVYTLHYEHNCSVVQEVLCPVFKVQLLHWSLSVLGQRGVCGGRRQDVRWLPELSP